MVDWIRHPFTTRARVHDSMDAPFVQLEWYVTDLPVLGETVINNRALEADKWTRLRTGEVPADDVRRKDNGRWSRPAGLTGTHVCGREWFRTGEPWPTSLPDTEYDADGIPLCCGRNAVAPVGGMELGGEVGDVFTWVDPTAGGLEIGGAAGDLARFVDPTAGGLEIGGAAGDLARFVDPTAGGLEIGGEQCHHPNDRTRGGMEMGCAVSETIRFVDAPRGGLEIGGAGNESAVWDDATAGGLEIGGDQAGDRLNLIDGTEGGLEIGDQAGDRLNLIDGTEGGLEIGGEVGELLNLIDGTAGGLEIGGAAGDTFWITVTGGAACASALPIATGIEYRDNEPAGVTTEWFLLSLAPGTYNVTETTLSGTGPAMSAFKGTSCGSLGVATNCPQNATTAVTTATGNIWLRCLRGGLATAGTWKVTIN